MHIPIFLVFYSTTFTLLLLLLLTLLLVTPGDAIYQSYTNQQLANVIVVAGAYFLTLLAASFIYATRIYATRTHLAALPRSARVPDHAAGSAVRRVVAQGLARAAAIAYAAHPRDLAAVPESRLPPELTLSGTKPLDDAMAVTSSARRDATLQQPRPAFGTIAHPGWTPPSSADLPGVQFMPVLRELPHLLEAKAVSLAPSSNLLEPGEPDEAAPQPDPLAVAFLQRPAALDARGYIAHLDALGAVGDSHAAASFAQSYERARFGGQALDEAEFRKLMAHFATLLRSLQSPDPAALQELARSDTASLSSKPSSAQSAPASLQSKPSDRSLRRPQLPERASTEHAATVLSQLAARSPPLPQLVLPTSQPAVGRSASPAPSPAASTPLAPTPSVHATPFFTPHRTSLSSNDGDRSAGSSDADDAARAGPPSLTRQRSHPRRRPPPVARSSHSSGGARSARTGHGHGLGLNLAMTRLEAARHSSTEDVGYVSCASAESGDGGSVIRRVRTAGATARHSGSGSDGGSVVVRPEDHGVGGLVPLPVVSGVGAGAVEMRMVDAEEGVLEM